MYGLREPDVRFVAKVVAKAVWARMSDHSIDTTLFAWREKEMMLNNACDAVMKPLFENPLPKASIVRPGKRVPTIPAGRYNQGRAMCDAFNALQGMPRDAADD